MVTPLCVDSGGLGQLDVVDLVWVKVIGVILETFKLTSRHAALVLDWTGLGASVKEYGKLFFIFVYECPGALG